MVSNKNCTNLTKDLQGKGDELSHFKARCYGAAVAAQGGLEREEYAFRYMISLKT